MDSLSDIQKRAMEFKISSGTFFDMVCKALELTMNNLCEKDKKELGDILEWKIKELKYLQSNYRLIKNK